MTGTKCAMYSIKSTPPHNSIAIPVQNSLIPLEFFYCNNKVVLLPLNAFDKLRNASMLCLSNQFKAVFRFRFPSHMASIETVAVFPLWCFRVDFQVFQECSKHISILGQFNHNRKYRCTRDWMRFVSSVLCSLFLMKVCSLIFLLGWISELVHVSVP